MKKVLITGGTGLVGTQLTKILIDKGYSVTVLTRKIPTKNNLPQITFATWDVKKGEIDIQALTQADYIVHLAGAGVMDKRWTDDYKKEIENSRVLSGKLLTDTLNKYQNNCKAFVSASAIGYYGPDVMGKNPFTEEDEYNNDFLGNTCKNWEDSTKDIKDSIRRSVLRIGIVLDKNGGALKEFAKSLPIGIAPILGTGNQIISWIHVEDLCKMIIYCLEHEHVSGTFNAVASEPISNKNFMKVLGKVKNKGIFIQIPVPSFILKTMLGESSIEILKSTTVSNEKIKNTGYVFSYDNLELALKDLYKT